MIASANKIINPRWGCDPMALSLQFLPSWEDVVFWSESHVPRMFWTLVFVGIAYALFNWIIRKRLAKNAKNEKQLAQIRVFMRMCRYSFVGVLVIVFISAYTNSLAALGISATFIGAALGWALQTPITGIAAWIMVLIKKPFQPGDRIIIDDVQGDVYDITVSHVILEECGGTTRSDDKSGRFIMIPMVALWTAKVTNYTHNDEYILREVPVGITYESNVDKAMKNLLEIATKHAKNALKDKKPKPFVRMEFKDSWIEIKVRFWADARDSGPLINSITKDFYAFTKKAKDVQIAYPHLQVLVDLLKATRR